MKAVLTLPRGLRARSEEGKRVVLVKMTDGRRHGGLGRGGTEPALVGGDARSPAYSSIHEYLAPALIGHDIFDIAGPHAKMNTELAPGLDPGQPIAKAAIDVAVHDLICRRLGIPLQSLARRKARDRVKLARLVSAPTRKRRRGSRSRASPRATTASR